MAVPAEELNPFTAKACKISRQMHGRAYKQYIIYSGPVAHLLLMSCVLMKLLHVPVRKRRQKGLRVSDFALFIFKRHHGSEGVKLECRAML